MKLMEDSILDSEGNIDKSKIKKLPPELRAEAYGSVELN